MRKIIIAAAAAACMVSCGIYNKYERPRIDDVNLVDDITVPGWKDIFTDGKLQSLIERALENNSDIRTALLRTTEAEASLRSTRWGYAPSADVNAGAAPVDGEWELSLKGTASWELDLFGKVTNDVRMGEASLEESKAYAQAVRTRLIATVAQSYYNLVMLDKKHEISLETLGSWDKSIATLETLKRAGKSNDIAVLQAKAKKMNLQGTSLTLEKNIATAEAALCTLIGESIRHIDRNEWTIPDIDTTFATGIPVAAVSARPDVRQAECALANAFYAVNASRAAFYPSIKLSGSAGWNGEAPLFDLSKWVTSLAGSLAEPVFNKARNINNLKISKARQEEALVAFRQCLLEAGNEVNSSLAEWNTAKSRTEVDHARIEALEDALAKIEKMMKYSTANYLEVLTAQQSLLDAQMDLVQDQYDQIDGLISLYHSIGGGR